MSHLGASDLPAFVGQARDPGTRIRILRPIGLQERTMNEQLRNGPAATPKQGMERRLDLEGFLWIGRRFWAGYIRL
jgi:hypothetical protein